MITEDIDYSAYAQLLIESGTGLKPGMKLLIRFQPEGADLARKCAETAYEHGAAYVEMALQDPYLTRARVNAQAGNEAALACNPEWLPAWEKDIVHNGWASLALVSHEAPGLLSGCDQQSLMLLEKHATEAIRGFRNAISSHAIPWCVADVPGPRWARDVLGEGAGTQQLWERLQPILLLDRARPGEAWKAKGQELIRRAEALNALQIDSLHFQDEGTDLHIGLTPLSRWAGGPNSGEEGFNFPNIPTEEVFTTPDRTRSHGHVRVTRPVEIRGTEVEGARLVFENGLLTDFSASRGAEALKAYFDTDPGARRLGEVALVGEDSPIAASSLIFHSILYDENASCHIALGSGYTFCMEGGDKMDTDEKKIQAGCNVSLVHRDFMIGSPTTRVSAVDAGGRETVIMEKGRFVL